LAAGLCAALACTGRRTAAGRAAAGRAPDLTSDFAAGLDAAVAGFATAAAVGFLVGVCDDAAAAHTIAATKAHKSLRISDVLILTGF
jgi:hypothetical protein